MSVVNFCPVAFSIYISFTNVCRKSSSCSTPRTQYAASRLWRIKINYVNFDRNALTCSNPRLGPYIFRRDFRL